MSLKEGGTVNAGFNSKFCEEAYGSSISRSLEGLSAVLNGSEETERPKQRDDWTDRPGDLQMWNGNTLREIRLSLYLFFFL